MKNTSLSRVNSSFATIVLVVIAVAPADAEIVVADSIESRVAHADAIIRAFVTTVDARKVHGRTIKTATLIVNETLKGTAPEHLKLPVTLYRASSEKPDRPSISKQEAVELLIFRKNGKITSLLRLDGKKSHGQGHRAFTLDMKVCKTKNSILAAVYSALAFEEKEKPIGGILIEVPGGELFSELFGGSAVYLSVPVDSRLETAVKRWTNAADISSLMDAYSKKRNFTEGEVSSWTDASMKRQVPRILKEIEKAKNSNAPRTPVKVD